MAAIENYTNWVIKTRVMHFLIFWDRVGQKSEVKVSAGPHSLRGGEENLPSLSSFWRLTVSLARGSETPVSASVFTEPSPSCLCVSSTFLSLTKTLTGFRAHPYPGWPHLKILTFITSAKVWFEYSHILRFRWMYVYIERTLFHPLQYVTLYWRNLGEDNRVKKRASWRSQTCSSRTLYEVTLMVSLLVVFPCWLILCNVYSIAK